MYKFDMAKPADAVGTTQSPGGGTQAMCQASSSILNKSLFFLDPETGETKGTMVHPRPQTTRENCEPGRPAGDRLRRPGAAEHDAEHHGRRLVDALLQRAHLRVRHPPGLHHLEPGPASAPSRRRWP
jgi:hypothetical protein